MGFIGIFGFLWEYLAFSKAKPSNPTKVLFGCNSGTLTCVDCALWIPPA